MRSVQVRGYSENPNGDKIAVKEKIRKTRRTVYLVNVDLFPLYSMLDLLHVLVLGLVLLVQVQVQIKPYPIPLFPPQPRQSRMNVVFLVVVDVLAVVVVGSGWTTCGLLCRGWSEYCWV
jgi:hypothetical protein